MTKAKIKNWFKDHKETIIQSLLVGAMCGGAFMWGVKDERTRIARGLDQIYKDGFLKLVDPSTGIEVGFEKSAELISKKYGT